MIKKANSIKIVSLILLIIVLIAFMFPIYYLLTTAFKDKLIAFANPPVWFFKPTIDNFKNVFSKASFPKAILNSVISAGASTILAIIFGTLGGYYFARSGWKKREGWANWILSTKIAPPILVIIPYYLIATKIHAYDKIYSLIVIYLAFNIPLVVLIMRSFFEDIPVEFDESGMIDGLSHFGVFRYIILPLAKSGIAATSVLTFLFTWNEFLFALMLTGCDARTLPVLVTGYLQQTQGILWSEMAAASLVIMLPIVIFIFFVQSSLVRGMTLGMMKDLK